MNQSENLQNFTTYTNFHQTFTRSLKSRAEIQKSRFRGSYIVCFNSHFSLSDPLFHDDLYSAAVLSVMRFCPDITASLFLRFDLSCFIIDLRHFIVRTVPTYALVVQRLPVSVDHCV